MVIRHFLMFLLCAAMLTALSAASHAETILFESGTLGNTGVTWQQALNGDVSGENVNANAFSGVRFELAQSVITTQVGGHFVAPSNSGATFFAAIIELDNENDFPDSHDLSTPDVLGTTLLNFPEPSGEVFGDLQLSLDSGWYALMFGSGLFGASGRGGALSNSTDIGSPDYIGYLSGFDWGNRLPSKRFVVTGTIVPEPTTLVLVCSVFVLYLAIGRSHRKSDVTQIGLRDL